MYEDDLLSDAVLNGFSEVSSPLGDEVLVQINETLSSLYELQVYHFCSVAVVLGLLISIIIAKGVSSRGL